MFVCIYVAIYFRVWYDGCGHENVRIFPGSAPEYRDYQCIEGTFHFQTSDESLLGNFKSLQ